MPMAKHGIYCNPSMIMAIYFSFRMLNDVVDIVLLRLMIEESRRVGSAIITKMNCVQFRQSVRPNSIVSFLGANMKKYAACEH
jgi:hypothetical protein